MRSKVTMTEYKFVEKTNAIEVTAQPVFLEEHSIPYSQQYVWAYKIRIQNFGADTVQLLSRCWNITDANGGTQEVRGPGVVGEQPVLKTGEVFEYSSFTTLPTTSGLMVGSYEMKKDDGETFQVGIPAFSLDSPEQMLLPN